MKVIIGCTSRPFNKLGYAEAYARIGAAGYTDLAVFANEGEIPVGADSSRDEVAAVRTAAANAGLSPSMLLGRTKLNEGLELAVDNYRRLIDNAAELGARWLLDLGTGNEAHYEIYYELMRQVAPHAGEAGIGISMKPHGGISLTSEHLLDACAQVDHPAFAICYDPGNIIYYTSGASRPENDMDEVAPRVSTAIVKDCIIAGGKPDVMVTPGDGLVDFAAVLEILNRAGFNGPYYVECVGGVEVDRINRDLAFTLGYIKGIQAAL